MKKIILITDGIHSKTLQGSIASDVEIVLFLDFENWMSKSKEELEQDKLILHEQLSQCVPEVDEIDFVFSFIQKNYISGREELADWVFDDLRRCGYPDEKVFDGWRIYRSFYPKEKYRRVLSDPDMDKLDGIVFGISHAEMGICSSVLPGQAANFASSSQDLYFNYVTAQKIWEEYPDKVSELKYAVIDMFDYTYFNFESMLTGATIDFFRASGLDCPAVFDEIGNKNLRQTAEEMNTYLRTQWAYSNEREKEIFLELFGDLRESDEHAYCDYPLMDRTGKISPEKIREYNASPTVTSVQLRIFEESIERNVRYFCSLLDFLKKKNSDIIIFCCLMPKYKDVEIFESSQFSVWKKFFENTLENVQKTYPFIYFNYKDDHELSDRADYYWDMTHFNYDGSIAFTKKLVEKIRGYL